MTPEIVLQAVAAESGVDVRSLLDKCRYAHLVRPRQLAMVVMRERIGMSCMKVALEMDRCEATIWEGYQSARKRLATDPTYRALHDRVVDKLSSPYGSENE